METVVWTIEWASVRNIAKGILAYEYGVVI